MWQNYRITITNPLGQPEEFEYNGYYSYTWHVSPRDYIPYRSQYENNFKSSAPKTIYNFTRLGSGRRGALSRTTYPAGDYAQYGYDSSGNRTSVTDAHGHT